METIKIYVEGYGLWEHDEKAYSNNEISFSVCITTNHMSLIRITSSEYL